MTRGASISLPFPNRGHIALVVRHKPARDIPPPGKGHADVIMPCGAPAGFFGEAAACDSPAAGFDVPGQVQGYAALAACRPCHVNAAEAMAARAVSGVLLIRVTARERELFTAAWRALRTRPGTFTIAGWTCSSHVALAFHLAGLVGRDVPDLDTADTLFHALRRRHADRCEDHYGYLGFRPRDGAGDDLDLPCDVGIDPARAEVAGPMAPPLPALAGDGARPGA